MKIGLTNYNMDYMLIKMFEIESERKVLQHYKLSQTIII
jgi:hypothetical protein